LPVGDALQAAIGARTLIIDDEADADPLVAS
jgi:hypothetical protein